MRNWKGDVLVADLEELETMDASEIYSKRQCERGDIHQRKRMKEQGDLFSTCVPVSVERVDKDKDIDENVDADQ